MSDLIRVRESKRFPELSVLKYKNKVFYKGLWGEDEDLLESRGRVINKDGQVVVNPFTKVFNYKERGTGIELPLNTKVLAIEKVNGFMAALTYYKDRDIVLVSTTGSLDSDFVDMASEYLEYAKKVVKERKDGRTHLFEIVHHNDPHIIKENFGAYYLGRRDISATTPFHTTYEEQVVLDQFAKEMRVARPNYAIMEWGDLLSSIKEVEHEGYMVYGVDCDISMKLKSPYYLVSKAYARRKDIFKVNKKIIPEEFYDLVDFIEKYEGFGELTEQERLEIIRKFLEE